MVRPRHPNKGVEAAVEPARFTVTLAGTAKSDPGLDDAAWEDCMTALLDDLTGRVLAAGLEDYGLCGVGSCDEAISPSVDREAGSLAEAIGSAIAAVERAGLSVARVDVGE
jgi:hypothetical protein